MRKGRLRRPFLNIMLRWNQSRKIHLAVQSLA